MRLPECAAADLRPVMTISTTTTMLPYRRQGEIDYASLDFNADELEVPPDHMEQDREIHEIYSLIYAHVTGFGARSDIFLSFDTNVCYDQGNLNVRIVPDLYLAFGVDAEAIRPRKLYLPWEAGKPPDLALEVASESTAQNDVRRKPDIYARIGVSEYWRFDPTGGRYYDAPLTGLRLVNGVYQTIRLTTEPDGILKGYSTVLELSLSWEQGWPRLYNPATGTYLENARQVWDAREAAELELDKTRLENERLREQLRRLQSES